MVTADVETATRPRSRRVRMDGRRQVLTYLDEGLMVRIQEAASVLRVNAYEVLEAAARQWLEKHESGPGSLSKSAEKSLTRWMKSQTQRE